MEKDLNFILNLGYIIVKFFFVLVWLYMTLVVFFGGEWRVMIGSWDSGLIFGFEGIYPSLLKWMKIFK